MATRKTSVPAPTPEPTNLSAAAVAARLREQFQQAALNTVDKFDHTEMAKTLIDTLEKDKNEVLAKMLGFDSRYGGKWEVDHCNGRSSPVEQYLNSETKAILDAWLRSEIEAFTKANGEKLRAQLKKAIQKEIADKLTNTWSAVNEAAKDLTRIWIADAVNTVKGEIMDAYRNNGIDSVSFGAAQVQGGGDE